ncbi:MAG: AMP-binding protein [Bdellovibrionota bacterium]
MYQSDENLKQYLFRILNDYENKIAFSVHRKEWVSRTYKDVIDLTIEIARVVKATGLTPNCKIAIILDSCPEYASAFFASAMLNNTTLLLDSKLSPEEMRHNLLHSDSQLIITGFTAKKATQDLLAILPHQVPVINIEDVKLSGRKKADLEEELKDLEGIPNDQIALLVYTSGTTSEPKGVMLTLGSIFFNGQSIQKAAHPHENATFLSILPLNHMLEFNPGMILQLSLGAHVVYANTLLPHEIVDRLKAFAYTDMIVVPLFLRSIKAALTREVNKSAAKKAYFKFAFAISKAIPIKALRRKLFAPVIKKFGGMKRFICGGAALDVQTQEFFTLLGITVCQGYGLTETAPVTSVNYSSDTILGSQGRAAPGTEMKIDFLTGEILIRGPHLMKGYYKKPELTAQVFNEDGWFKTGDIGHLDEKGNLFITGRLKELIVLGNGKKVFPDEVESLMQISDNIKEIIIVGAQEQDGPLKGTESVCAIVVPTDELLKLADITLIRDILEKEIRKNAEKIAPYKRPSRIYLSFEELPKTNTRKNKRTLIKRLIEQGVYNESGLPNNQHPSFRVYRSATENILPR